MSTDLSELLDAAVEAARRGAAELEAWRPRFKVREKARADLVTDADHASQAAIKRYLLGRFPGHLFLGEEESVGKPIESLRPAPESPPVWVVDPLDGTANYAHGVPAYCVNVGLLIDGKPAVGVTFDPRLNELFTAAAGRGAYLNGERIRVSTIPTLRDGLFATGFPAGYQAQLRNLAAWHRVSAHAQALRRTGSTAVNMAYVAAGRFDGYWAYDNWPWDVLPGAVLVLEAGGTLTTADGATFDPFRTDLLATNGLTHDELRRALSTDSTDDTD
jgi:myo-inositol-1(or 4)-monophosphatase